MLLQITRGEVSLDYLLLLWKWLLMVLCVEMLLGAVAQILHP